MSLLTDFWEKFAAAGRLSLDNAVNLLIVDAPSLNPRDGQNWFTAIAGLYNRFGIIDEPTYASLANDVVGDGAKPASDLFAALENSVINLSATPPVVQALEIKQFDDDSAQIPVEIARLEGLRDAETDPVLKRSYQAGIDERKSRQREIELINSVRQR